MEATINGENGGRSDAEKEVDEEELHLKKMIASHPLYGLLIESHFNCLKVGLDEFAEFDVPNDAWKQLANSKRKATTAPPNSSELDQFMEAYCMALSKLKEAIEEPTRETKAFINATYIELKDLNIEPNDPQESLMWTKNLDDDSSH